MATLGVRICCHSQITPCSLLVTFGCRRPTPSPSRMAIVVFVLACISLGNGVLSAWWTPLPILQAALLRYSSISRWWLFGIFLRSELLPPGSSEVLTTELNSCIPFRVIPFNRQSKLCTSLVGCDVVCCMHCFATLLLTSTITSLL